MAARWVAIGLGGWGWMVWGWAALAAEPVGTREVIYASRAADQDVSGRSQAMRGVWQRHLARVPPGWVEMVTEVKGLTGVAQLRRAHQGINQQIHFQNDLANEWKSPAEAFATGGDCEDYAVAKLLLLREAGLDEQGLRVVTLAPSRAGMPYHVVLVARVGEEVWVLDSPGRMPEVGDMVVLGQFKDRTRPVAWSGWFGGFNAGTRSMEGEQATWVEERGWTPNWNRRGGYVRGSVSGFRLVDRVPPPGLGGVSRFDAPLSGRERDRVRYQRQYYHDPTLDHSRRLDRGEIRYLNPELKKHGP